MKKNTDNNLKQLNTLYNKTVEQTWLYKKDKVYNKKNYKDFIESYKIFKDKIKTTDYNSQTILKKIKENLDDIKFWGNF